jgi:hypothetical protein
MVLPMARPWKHPVTSVYWFRKAVPKDLRPLVGKREVKFTLGTKDLRQARRLHAAKQAEGLEDWAKLRSSDAVAPAGLSEPAAGAALCGTRSLSHRDCAALAGEVYTKLIEFFHGERNFFVGNAAAMSVLIHKQIDGQIPWAYGLTKHPGFHKAVNGQYGRFVDAVLRERGLRIDEKSRNMLLDYVFDSAAQAWKQIRKECGGDYSPDPDADRFPEMAYTLDEAWAKYQEDHRPQPSTVKRWTPAIESMKGFGGKDITRLTDRKVVDWKNKLLASGLDPITVRDVYVASLRAVLNCAKANLRIKQNPAAGIEVHVPRKLKLREREFTEKEARTILNGALQPFDGRISSEHAAARRWAPWICA